MLLADFGNTRVHIFDGRNVYHLTHEEAIAGYRTVPLLYICVNHNIKSHIEYIAPWEDISSCLSIKREYETMGADRKALCLSHPNGIFIDAGSAITVDIVKDGIYQGGFILPGIRAYLEAYKMISPALDTGFNRECSLASLPRTTKDSVSYGIIASIKAVLDGHKTDLPLYFTGGDGEWLSSLFPNSKFDELLVFKGMQKALKDKLC